MPYGCGHGNPATFERKSMAQGTVLRSLGGSFRATCLPLENRAQFLLLTRLPSPLSSCLLSRASLKDPVQDYSPESFPCLCSWRRNGGSILSAGKEKWRSVKTIVRLPKVMERPLEAAGGIVNTARLHSYGPLCSTSLEGGVLLELWQEVV